MDFFLWGCMKENVYETEIGSRKELVAKINTTAMEIHQCRLGNVQQEISEMKHVFVREGGHFEHLL